MIKIENTEVYGWEAAIRGMRNPMNSWSKSDSKFEDVFEEYEEFQNYYIKSVELGPNDLDLMHRLYEGGPVHSKYLRMITVTCDITAPLYWWKEYDTYKVGTVANSCSTMHKIHEKEFTIDDFSTEHLINGSSKIILGAVINLMNQYRLQYVASKNKEWWWQIIQLLPTSYNQRRTVQMNYEVLMSIYKWRKNHKLDEWHTFCSWIEELPYFKDIRGGIE